MIIEFNRKLVDISPLDILSQPNINLLKPRWNLEKLNKLLKYSVI